MPSDSEDVSMRVNGRKGHQSSGLFSFKRLHFLNEAKSLPHIPCLWKKALEIVIEAEEWNAWLPYRNCHMIRLILEVFVDGY